MNQTLGLRKEAGRSEVGEQGPHPGFEQSFPLLHGLLQEPLHAGDIRVQAPTARGKRSGQMMAVPHLPSSPPSLPVPHPFLESQFISWYRGCLPESPATGGRAADSRGTGERRRRLGSQLCPVKAQGSILPPIPSSWKKLRVVVEGMWVLTSTMEGQRSGGSSLAHPLTPFSG